MKPIFCHFIVYTVYILCIYILFVFIFYLHMSFFFCNFAADLVRTSTCVRVEIFEYEKYSIYHQSHLRKFGDAEREA